MVTVPGKVTLQRVWMLCRLWELGHRRTMQVFAQNKAPVGFSLPLLSGDRAISQPFIPIDEVCCSLCGIESDLGGTGLNRASRIAE